MSQLRPNDPNARLTPTGDEQSSAARLRRAQHRAQRDYLLEEMQSDLQHFSSTIQRLQDHFRATPQTDTALARTLESSQAVFTALETAYNHLLMLRNTLRNPSLPQTLSSLQLPPPSTPTPVRSSLLPESNTLSSSTGRSLYTGLPTNGRQETVPPLMAETSPAEERAARYVALSPSNRSIPTRTRVHYGARRSHSADRDRVLNEDEPQQQSEAQDDVLWYSVLPPPPPPQLSDRPQLTQPPRFNLGRTRLARTLLDPTTPQQVPSSVVQFTRQSQPSVSAIGSTSSSSSSISISSASQTDTNNDDPNSTNGGGDSGGTGNDDLTSVNRAANRLFQRLSNLHETTRRLRERRWSNLPGLAEGRTSTAADLDPFDPVAPARRPDVYANLLRRHMSNTAPPPNAGSDTGAEEENKENIEGELVLVHIVCGRGSLTNTLLVHLQWR